MTSPIIGMFVQQFVQTDNKETPQVCVGLLLWEESTGDRWIPHTKDSYAEKSLNLVMS